MPSYPTNNVAETIAGPSSIGRGDLDGDGDNDLDVAVVNSSDGRLSVLSNTYR